MSSKSAPLNFFNLDFFTFFTSIRNCSFFLVVSVLCFTIAVSPGLAENLTGFHQSDALNFLEPGTGPILVDPGTLRINSAGKLTVWDRGLQNFFRLPTTNTDVVDTGSRFEKKRYGEFLNQYHTGKLLHEWDLTNTPNGFFDDRGTFWYYDRDLAQQSDTFLVFSSQSDTPQLKLSGPVKSIIPTNNHFIVQYASRDTSLVRIDPYSQDNIVDTATLRLDGTLVGFTREGKYITKKNNTLKSYDGSRQVDSRTFGSIQEVTVKDDSIYVMSGGGELVRLDLGLTAQYTFLLPRRSSYRSFVIRSRKLYVSTPKGIFKARLDESDRSFFSQSSPIDLSKIAGVFPDLSIEPKSDPKIRLKAPGSTPSLVIKNGKERLPALTKSDSGLKIQKWLREDDLSDSAFQYFKVESSFWDGENTLYYYFPEEQAVESYDTGGHPVRRQKISLNKIENLKNLKFLAANDQRIYFTGDVLDSDRGYEKKIIIYSWSGDLKKVTAPRHPLFNGEYRNVNPTDWEYAGKNLFLELHDNYIVAYDHFGLPRTILNEVYLPVNVARRGNTLYVLDLNGHRVQTFEIDELPSRRVGLPSTEISVKDAASKGSKAVLTVRAGTDDRTSLFEYDRQNLDYQEVFQHPTQSLLYPSYSSSGDSVFFFGTNNNSNFTLYGSDAIKYTAKALGEIENVRNEGFYASGRGLFFVPVRTKKDTNPQYRYLHLKGDTSANLLNSSNLIKLVPGGFTGYYGLVKERGGYSLVTGYLDRSGETTPLSWNRSDTLYRTDEKISDFFHRQDELYFLSNPRDGFSRLGRIAAKPGQIIAPNQEADVTWLGKFRGKLKWVSRWSSRYEIILKSGAEKGKFYHYFPINEPEDGGIDGKITLPDPGELEGINLRTNPGGITIQTNKNGGFSQFGIPAGYVQLNPISYDYHFSYPIQIPITPGEYTVRSSLPLVQHSELPILERGLNYFNNEKYDRARISINAFREIIQKGPYFRWTDGLLEEIFRIESDTPAQFNLYKRRPGLYAHQERLDLFKNLQSNRDKLKILNDYRGSTRPDFRSFLKYRINMLRAERSPEAYKSLNSFPFLLSRHQDEPIVPIQYLQPSK